MKTLEHNNIISGPLKIKLNLGLLVSCSVLETEGAQA